MTEMSELVALYNTKQKKKRMAKQWEVQKEAFLEYKQFNAPEDLVMYSLGINVPAEHKEWIRQQIDLAFEEEVLETQVCCYNDDELILKNWKHKGLNYRIDEETNQVYHTDFDLNLGVFIRILT